MNLTLTPYKDALVNGKAKLDETLAPMRAYRAKKQAELKVAELDEQIVSTKTVLAEKAAEKEIKFDSLICLMDELGLLERKKKQLETLISMLFPAEVDA